MSEFLDLYKEFEDALEIRYSGTKRKFTSPIYEYLNDDESLPVRDKLNVCREIRNLLTHTALMDGKPVVEPSDAVVSAMKEIIDYVKRPPLAIEFATKADNIFKANLSQSVIKVMTIMDKYGYSHIPIMENGKFYGVFSAGSIFNYILKNYSSPITRNTTIKELETQLKIDMHTENYAFVSEKCTLFEARNIFEQIKGKNKRISVIFVTKHGNKDEPLLGMLTPYDTIREIKQL